MHLSCLYVEDYTDQEYKAFFEIGSSGNLTCRILLEYYFQMWQYHFFKTYTQTICPKGPFVATEHTYLSLYTTCSGSVLNRTSLYNRNSARYKALPNSDLPREAAILQSRTLTHLYETNMHGSYTYLMYNKYPLFYESPKNWGYYAHAQTVCTRPLLGGRGLGTRLHYRLCVALGLLSPSPPLSY